MSYGVEPLTLEFTALRVINVENFADDAAIAGVDVRKVDWRNAIESLLGAANKTVTNKALRNMGPSVSYKLRDASGQVIEYNNSILPVRSIAEKLPSFEVLDDVMYKGIAVGFAFFTIDAVLGGFGLVELGAVTGAGTRKRLGP